MFPTLQRSVPANCLQMSPDGVNAAKKSTGGTKTFDLSTLAFGALMRTLAAYNEPVEIGVRRLAGTPGTTRRFSAMKVFAIVRGMDLVVDGDEGRSKNLARAADVSCSAYAPADGQKACSGNR